MSKEINEILKSLSNRDVEALKSIYDYRCLSASQIYRLHYMKSTRSDDEVVSDSYCKKKLNEFEELEILEKVEHISEFVYFLTTKGINLIRFCFDLPTNIYDFEKGVVERGYYRAFELKVSNKYINHQLSMNEFLVKFKLMEQDIYWKYYDEKYISDFRNIRPDGLLRMLDVDFFLEMDMATESKKQLYDKWDNYRRFLDSQEFGYLERKVVVLFIIENTANPQARIDLIKHTLGARLMDKVDINFDIHIGTTEDILELLDYEIKKSKGRIKSKEEEIVNELSNNGFSVVLGEKLQGSFNNVEYDFYARKLDENNNIIKEGGKFQEFIVDSYNFEPFSVLKKIAFLNLSNVYFREKAGRELSYLIVGESEEDLYRDLKIMDLLVVDNVYYTTIARLKEKKLPEAIFQFDFLGNVHSFKDMGLQDRKFEFNVKEEEQED